MCVWTWIIYSHVQYIIILHITVPLWLKALIYIGAVASAIIFPFGLSILVYHFYRQRERGKIAMATKSTISVPNLSVACRLLLCSKKWYWSHEMRHLNVDSYPLPTLLGVVRTELFFISMLTLIHYQPCLVLSEQSFGMLCGPQRKVASWSMHATRVCSSERKAILRVSMCGGFTIRNPLSLHQPTRFLL